MPEKADPSASSSLLQRPFDFASPSQSLLRDVIVTFFVAALAQFEYMVHRCYFDLEWRKSLLPSCRYNPAGYFYNFAGDSVFS
jgi:hypothetical protein